MKQVAQAVKGGTPRVLDVPAPALRPGGVLVRTSWSLVSAGTDRMVVELAGKSLAGKARSRPDQVKKVLAKLRTDGVGATFDAIRSRLEGDLPLGYSSSGTVIAVADDVDGLSVGQRVACAGAGYATHAETVFVPKNLVVPVPGGLPLKYASTVTLGAIAMQGFRRTEAVLGERVGVVGLGLLGLLTVQILRSAGCHVFAVDLDPERVEMAKGLGAEVALARSAGGIADRARAFSGGHGLDAVVVTAASSSSDPVVLAGEMCRLGGRVVVVGAVGMDLPRRLFYEKELELKLARSYGPGRYDPIYEERGIDYPYPWVRFTEGRNMEEYLALLGRGEVDVEPLLTHEYGIEEGESAYDFLLSAEGRAVVGLLFKYEERVKGDPGLGRRGRFRSRQGRGGGTGIGFVGAGAFARGVLLPAVSRLPGCRTTGVVTTTGLTAVNAGRLGGFEFVSTRLEDLLEDRDTAGVVIATRHREHASIAMAALRAGKDVFLEKPLALNLSELSSLMEVAGETNRLLMVGFNRRFAPTFAEVRDAYHGRTGPLQMVYRVNGGPLPDGHWTRDPEEGGGRILGEVCHFVDLLIALAGSMPRRVTAEGLPADGVTATFRFDCGSVGTVIYATAGDAASGKERLEVFGEGASAVLDDFRRVTVTKGGRSRRPRVRPGKGHREEMSAFLTAVREGRASPVPFGQACWSTRATLAVLESVQSGSPVDLEYS